MDDRVARTPEARADLIEQAEFIANDNLDAAYRFLDAAEETFRFLAANPHAGQRCRFKHPDAANIRVWRVKGFENSLIFYRASDAGVLIVRVLHGARDIDSLFEQE